ncbi:MAG: cytochrome c biogenesis protein CcsA [Tannerellaceae bacterium]|jgi:cytochrome c-type biogenesis protein CcsB|nr:cytochrome c biogenesis protein CcsA [Tannerellaceae bacterium]
MKKEGRIFFSGIVTIILFIVYAVCLAAATFLEKYWGTEAAFGMIYYALWFFLLQFLGIVHLIGVIIYRGLWHKERWSMLMVHGALMIILCGALVSHTFGKEGTIYLREGDITNYMVVHTSKGEAYHLLPFRIELKDFILTRYLGSSSPSSFESRLMIYVDGEIKEAWVYMNNVLDIKGYRLFQASFDRDEKGTVLTVNKDAVGRNITYTGYFLLFGGLIAGLFSSKSRFGQLRRKLFLIIVGSCQLIFLPDAFGKEMVVSPMMNAVSKYAPDVGHAERFGSLPVQSTAGRTMPVNTLASELLRKVHRSDHIGSLSPDQFLLGLMVMPEMWMRVQFIALPSKSHLHEVFHLSEPYCTYVEVFDDEGNYKLQRYLEEAYSKAPAERNRFDKDLIRFDERIQTLHQLFQRRLIRLFPHEDDTWYAAGDDLSKFSVADSTFITGIVTWYVEEIRAALHSGEWQKCDEILGMIKAYQQARSSNLTLLSRKLDAELLYNSLNPFKDVRKTYLITGLLLLVVSLIAMFYTQCRFINVVIRILTIVICIAFTYHLGGMALRGYIAGNAPWSNAYETMVFAAAATMGAGLYFCRRNTLIFALSTLFAGTILFVSGLNWLDPQINPLVPVLKSPWLMFHVSVIMAAYGFFGLCTLASLAWLLLRPFISPYRNEDLATINEMSLHIGLVLMTIGTFLGAIWANESWGRYWGWDPKETWALITIVSYAALLHLRFIPGFRHPRLFHILTILAFTTVLMTYFGVNYYLSGMHSYQ